MVARDFEYTYEGHTITYTVIDEETRTCKTKDGYKDKYEIIPGNKISGEVIFPANPKDGDIDYTLTEIGEYAFSNCENLQSVILPPSIERFPGYPMSMYVFDGCRQLMKYACPSGTENIIPQDERAIIYDRDDAVIEDGFIYGSNKSIMYFVPLSFNGILGSGGYSLPESVTTIGKSAFRGCRNLKEVAIPNSLTNIGEYAFSYCSGLIVTNIPQTVTSIKNGTYQKCTNLVYIDIPSSITYIGKSAFEECTSLPSITIPSSVTKLDEGAFGGCEALSYVEIPNSVTYLGSYAFALCSSLVSVKIPSSVTKLDNNTFMMCTALSSIEIPNSVTYLGSSAFFNCTSLTSLEIPNSVITIEPAAFLSCAELSTIVIPESVTYIGDGAFAECKLSSVVCKSKEPISQICENTFSTPIYGIATLYVPEGCIDRYKGAKVWSNFSNISDEDINGVYMIDSNAERIDWSLPYEVYNLDGVQVGEAMDGLTKGIYVIKQRNVAVKVSVK